MTAFETAKLANLDSSSQEQYQQSLKVLRDNFSVMETAIEEAVEVAVQEAREAALAEGELKAMLKIAINLKATGELDRLLWFIPTFGAADFNCSVHVSAANQMKHDHILVV